MIKYHASLIIVLAVSLASQRALVAQGIPEPSLVLYGTIRNTADNNFRVSFGALTWQYRNTSSGRIVTFNTRVTNVLDQFSYVLEIYCESLATPFAVSSNALQLTPTAAPFDRSQVVLGTNMASFVTPSQASTSISSTNRGRIERVDLTVHIPPVDQDGNALPDDWEANYFGFVGVDPNGDEDGDGLSNIGEYRAGTNPLDPASAFTIIHYFRQPPNGFQVEWSSVDGRVYAIDRSPNLQTGFITIRTDISATPPKNVFLDNTATGDGPFFYRLRLK